MDLIHFCDVQFKVDLDSKLAMAKYLLGRTGWILIVESTIHMANVHHASSATDDDNNNDDNEVGPHKGASAIQLAFQI